MCFNSPGEEHQWKFASLLVDQRVARITRLDNGFELHDAATGELIDPRNPFPEQMAQLP
jgi:hypothetical protein